MDRILETPLLSGGRPRARALRAQLPNDLSDARVILDCRDLEVSTESFADEMVIQVLRDSDAMALDVINVDSQTAAWFDTSAAEWEVSERLTVDRRP